MSAGGNALARPAGRGRVVALGLAIFVAGCLAGAGVTVLSARRLVGSALLRPEEASLRLSTRMAHRLDLTPDQEGRVREIVDRRHRSLLALRGEFRPRMEEELAGVRDEISAVLDERQERAWNDWFDRRCRSWMPGGMPPPPQPRRGGMRGPGPHGPPCAAPPPP